MLQTAGYTTALLEDARDRRRVPRGDVAEAVAERARRQRVLTRAGHRFVFVIEEPVLRYRFCEPAILRGQLLHLREPRVFPRCGWGSSRWEVIAARFCHAKGSSCSTKSWSAWSSISGVLSVSQPREVGMYLRDFTDLARIAVHGQAARDLHRRSAARSPLTAGGQTRANFDRACACSLPSSSQAAT